MATFRDGLEAAARLVESELGDRHEIEARARAIRAIEEPAEPLDALKDGFQQFKSAWPKGRNNHWTPAWKAFLTAVKKRKHAISAIVTGTQAYAATNPEFQYVPAPAVFLNQDRFLTDYRPNGGDAPRGNKNGATSLFDVELRFAAPKMHEGR